MQVFIQKLISFDKVKNEHYLRRLANILSHYKDMNTSKVWNKGLSRHHIVPRAWDKTLEKDPDNIVVLPDRAHFLVHKLYFKAFPSDGAMANAFWLMVNTHSGRVTSREYAEARQKSADHQSGKIRGKKMNLSEEERQRRAAAARSLILQPQVREKVSQSKKGKSIHTEESRRLLSEAAKNRVVTEETKQKQSAALKGKPKSEEHIRHFSEATKGKEKKGLQKQVMCDGIIYPSFTRAKIAGVKSLQYKITSDKWPQYYYLD